MNYKKILIVLIVIYSSASVFEIDDRVYGYANKVINELKGIKNSIQLDEYKVDMESKKITEIKKNLSGLTYNITTKTLFAISNRPQIIYELTKNGKLIRKIKLKGFKDTEGIVFIKDNLFAIVDEKKQSIYIIKIDENTEIIKRKKVVSKFLLKIDSYSNLGYEGIAYDKITNNFFIVNEKLPMQLITISNWLNDSENISINFESKIQQLDHFMDDFSGLHFDYKSRNILFLSEESSLVAEVSLSGDKLSFMDLESGFVGLKNDIPQAEGITMDEDGALYIVSEPNLFYRFVKK